MSEIATATAETFGLEIPSHWGWSTFKDLSERVTVGHVGSMRNEYRDTGVPFLRGQNVRANRFDPKGLKFVSPEFHETLRKSSLEAGDIVVTRSGDVGIACVIPATLGVANCSDLVIIKQPRGIDPKFAAYYLNSAAKRMIAAGKVGVAITHFNTKSVAALPIPLPPLPEQRRIVVRIEELFSRLDAGVAALRHAKAQLQRYRQSVLAAAVTGQLTQGWREQHPDTEPAEELLERILQERREKWSGRGKYKEPDDPDISKMPEIPTAWKWARLDAICAIGSGMSVSKNRKHKNPVEVPYLRVANVQRGHLVLNEVKRMKVEEDRVPLLALKKGDVLFNEGGDRDKLGRGWIWEGQIEPCITQNHVFRASAYDLEGTLPKFLSHWGNIFGQQFFLDEGTQTTNLASINKGVLSSFPVPVPTAAEQHQIVAEVESRTTAIDHLEAELDRQITRSNRLRQSTLAAAFAGKFS